MKRFLCTICERIIRVRTLPASVYNPSETLLNRKGVCNSHTADTSRSEYIRRNNELNAVNNPPKQKRIIADKPVSVKKGKR